jgi:hypothetical protein
MLAPLTTCTFMSFSVQPWHLPFTNPREATLAFPLAFSLLVTSQVEWLNSCSLISRIPETREVNGVLTPFTRRHVSACLSPGPTLWFYHVSLVPSFDTSRLRSPSAASFVSQHPKCRDPELLVTPYHNLRLRDFRDKSLDSPTVETQNAEMANSDSLLMLAPKQKFSLYRDFTFHDLANLDARFSVLQLMNPRNESS